MFGIWGLIAGGILAGAAMLGIVECAPGILIALKAFTLIPYCVRGALQELSLVPGDESLAQ